MRSYRTYTPPHYDKKLISVRMMAKNVERMAEKINAYIFR
jgi:hypothetical protein